MIHMKKRIPVNNVGNWSGIKMSDIKIGVVFPQTEIGNDPQIIREFAQVAEGAGSTHLLAYDHVLGAHPDREPRLWGPYTHETAFHEPFVLFGYLAAVTSKMEIVTGVIILPQRQTALVAKQAAEIDILSGGRLRLGVGTGWNYVEYDSLNEDFSNRGAREEEQIEVLRKLWKEPVVDYTGKWHRIDRAGLLPLPDREIPIWLGGFTEPAFRRAAKCADGFIFGNSSDSAIQALESIKKHLESNQRSLADFGIEAMLDYGAGPEVWEQEIKAWQDAGATHLSVRTMNIGLANPTDHIKAIENFFKVIR